MLIYNISAQLTDVVKHLFTKYLLNTFIFFFAIAALWFDVRTLLFNSHLFKHLLFRNPAQLTTVLQCFKTSAQP